MAVHVFLFTKMLQKEQGMIILVKVNKEQ